MPDKPRSQRTIGQGQCPPEMTERLPPLRPLAGGSLCRQPEHPHPAGRVPPRAAYLPSAGRYVRHPKHYHRVLEKPPPGLPSSAQMPYHEY